MNEYPAPFYDAKTKEWCILRKYKNKIYKCVPTNSEELEINKMIEAIECKECGNMLPPHTREEHLDATNPIHKCPHRHYVYKCSWFESKKHKISHTDMYFNHLDHTLWVLDSFDYQEGLARVELVPVERDSPEYEMALANSSPKPHSPQSPSKLVLLQLGQIPLIPLIPNSS